MKSVKDYERLLSKSRTKAANQERPWGPGRRKPRRPELIPCLRGPLPTATTPHGHRVSGLSREAGNLVFPGNFVVN